jgi:hypothetical protein
MEQTAIQLRQAPQQTVAAVVVAVVINQLQQQVVLEVLVL